MNGPRADRRARVAVWLLAAGGAGLLAWITRKGLGLTPDSLTYLDTARQVLDGRGLLFTSWYGTLQPLTHYPPVYPWLLAQLGRIAPSLEAVRAAAGRPLRRQHRGRRVLLARMLPARRGWAWGRRSRCRPRRRCSKSTPCSGARRSSWLSTCWRRCAWRPTWNGRAGALAAAGLLAGMAGLTRFLGVVLMGRGSCSCWRPAAAGPAGG